MDRCEDLEGLLKVERDLLNRYTKTEEDKYYFINTYAQLVRDIYCNYICKYKECDLYDKLDIK